MQLTILGVPVEIENFSAAQYHKTCGLLDAELLKSQQVRVGIVKAFQHAMGLAPTANPSDIWHHVIYRHFMDARKGSGSDPHQSWVRAGGDALEIVLSTYYSELLKPHGIRLRVLLGNKQKEEALKALGCAGKVGKAKLDTVLEGFEAKEWIPFGGAHIKASMGERVNDDEPTSRALQARGHFSPLVTMDVKSFPPTPRVQKDLVNRGEFGSPENPSVKRRYIEENGSFDNCYSFNLRTIPSSGVTPSGKRIFSLHMDGKEDQFVRDSVKAWK